MQDTMQASMIPTLAVLWNERLITNVYHTCYDKVIIFWYELECYKNSYWYSFPSTWSLENLRHVNIRGAVVDVSFYGFCRRHLPILCTAISPARFSCQHRGGRWCDNWHTSSLRVRRSLQSRSRHSRLHPFYPVCDVSVWRDLHLSHLLLRLYVYRSWNAA